MEDKRTEAEDAARSKARALLGRTRSIQGDLALSMAITESGPAAQRLAAIAANLRAAEVQLEQAIDSPGADKASLASLNMLLHSTELAADAAIQSAATTTALTALADVGEAAVTASTRRMVGSISREIFEQKIFDRYLHFNSEADERAYREREADRQRAIAELNATGRPHDALAAAELLHDQLRDAGAHGATKSPDYQRFDKQIEQQKQQQQHEDSSARGADGVRGTLRLVLEDRGIPRDQIEQILASPNPTRAALPFLSRSPTKEHEPHTQAAAEPAHPWQAPPSAPALHAAELATTPKPPAVVASLVAGVGLDDDGLAAPATPAAGKATAVAQAAPDQARAAMAKIAASVTMEDDGLGAPAGGSPSSGHGLPDKARPTTPPASGRTTA